MPLIEGSYLPDVLRGTVGNDTLAGYGSNVAGTPDRLIGRTGADVYAVGGTPYYSGELLNYVIRDDGSDGAIDAITGAGAIYHSASFGYQGWATVKRAGDNLVIHLPSKPYRFHDPAKPSYDIKIINHFSGDQVESIEAGGRVFQLPDGTIGGAQADMIGGSRFAETIVALEGDDYVDANGGRDNIDLGAGADTAFGGNGGDTIRGGSGNDLIFGGSGHDKLFGDAGSDRMEGGLGNDFLRGGDGGDWLVGEAGNDRLIGGAGADILAGGIGDDLLIGGRDADTYVVSVDTVSGSGADTIRESGNAGSWASHDVLQIRGLYGPSSGSSASAYDQISFERVGTDAVIHIAGSGSITMENMLDATHHNQFFVEEMELSAGYWSPIRFQFLDGAVTNIGDDRTIFLTYGAKLNEVLFGTDGNDQIFGGTGTNFVWTGDGADTLIYKIGDGEPLAGMGGGVSHDIVEDFDISQDRLDFTEVGITMADLTISEDADGDAVIEWDSGTWEEADIAIELRGVSAADVTADLFIF